MPPRRQSFAPVDPTDLRTRLEAGKIVRVRVRPSAQFPDGVLGRVRKVGDPAVDGEEYISVEVPLGGGKDVVPFPPGDLSDPAVAAPAAVRPAPARSGSVEKSVAPRRLQPVPPLAETAAAPPVPPAAEAAPADDVPARASRPASARPSAKRGTAKPVTITLSTDPDGPGTWKVEARVGSRAVVRPTPVSPARVWDMVQGLDNEELNTVVQTHLAEHRRAAQQRADRLAAELAAVRAELDTLPPAP